MKKELRSVLWLIAVCPWFVPTLVTIATISAFFSVAVRHVNLGRQIPTHFWWIAGLIYVLLIALAIVAELKWLREIRKQPMPRQPT